MKVLECEIHLVIGGVVVVYMGEGSEVIQQNQFDFFTDIYGVKWSFNTNEVAYCKTREIELNENHLHQDCWSSISTRETGDSGEDSIISSVPLSSLIGCGIQ